MSEPEPKFSHVKLSITLREDVARKLEEIMLLTGLDRSGAIALAIQLLSLKRLKDQDERTTPDK